MGGAPLGNVNGCAWKSEHSDALEALVIAGERSFASIASALNDKFGTSYTRNAVIGRSGRMGLSNKTFVRSRHFGTKGSRKSAKKAVNKPVVRFIRANGNSNRMRMLISVETDGFTQRCVEVVPRHIALLDLELNDCRYPCGDSNFTFCGHPKTIGSSYCQSHFFLTLRDRRGRHEATEKDIAQLKKLTRSTLEVLNMAIVDGEICA